MGVPSNAVSINNPTLPVDQSIYEQSDTQKARLGTRLQVGDKVFYYARLSTSANVLPGILVTAPQIIASHQSGIVAAASTAQSVNVITITAGTAFTADQYAEGYLIFASQALTGGGTCYRVKSHPAIATGATGQVTLYDGIATQVAAAMPCNFVPSAFNLVKVGSAALDTPVGVVPCSVTTGNYFWLQTWGPASARHSAGTPAGAAIAMATLGMVGAYSVTGTLGSTGNAQIDYLTILGKNSNLAATATEHNPVFLSIIP